MQLPLDPRRRLKLKDLEEFGVFFGEGQGSGKQSFVGYFVSLSAFKLPSGQKDTKSEVVGVAGGFASDVHTRYLWRRCWIRLWLAGFLVLTCLILLYLFAAWIQMIFCMNSCSASIFGQLLHLLRPSICRFPWGCRHVARKICGAFLVVETSDLLLTLSTKSRSELMEVWRFRAFHQTFDPADAVQWWRRRCSGGIAAATMVDPAFSDYCGSVIGMMPWFYWDIVVRKILSLSSAAVAMFFGPILARQGVGGRRDLPWPAIRIFRAHCSRGHAIEIHRHPLMAMYFNRVSSGGGPHRRRQEKSHRLDGFGWVLRTNMLSAWWPRWRNGPWWRWLSQVGTTSSSSKKLYHPERVNACKVFGP